MNWAKGCARGRIRVRLAVVLLLVIALCGAMALNGCQPQAQIQVEISEVVSSNDQSYVDEECGAVDWIELHNVGKTSVSLNGWFLTDKYSSRNDDCILPNITLAPDGYCLILANKEMAREGRHCLPFSISKAGETLSLFDPSGQLSTKVTVPELEKDVSWALDPTGQYGYCLSPTPGQPNTTEIVAKLTPEMLQRGSTPGRQSPVTLWINEVCTSPEGREADWIELYNPTDQAVDLTGFFLSDAASDPMKGALPSLTIPAQGYLTIPLGAAADRETGISAFSLSSKGETIYLFDDSLGLIDAVETPPLQEGLVFARGTDGVFGYCGVPTPGAANHGGIYAEPLRIMAADAPLHLNEGLFRNRYSAIDAYGDHSDWVELVNRSDATISLSGYYLSDRRDEPRRWALPALDLGPGEFLLVFLSGRNETAGELHAPFSVSERDDGCCLYNANTLELECLPYPDDLGENVSVGLDETGAVVYYGYPTPGRPNAQGYSDQEACGLPGGDVYISEVCAGGDTGDWIELYNRGVEALDLGGWHLSDDPREPQKLALGPVRLEANAYYVVKLTKGAEDPPFSVSQSGEELVLTDKDGIVRDVFATGALRPGMTSGRKAEDVSQRVFFATATQGKRNDSAAMSGYASTPVFSEAALFHDGPFELSLTVQSPQTVIRYTLDGSVPTQNSAVYTQPLLIRENTTVRAIGFAEGRFASEEAVATFLFRSSHTLPVVCITADPKRWEQLTNAPFLSAGLTEQKAWITYYEADGSLGAAFPAGISPRGNASLSYPQKSLSVHLRASYGQSTVTYPFWGQSSFLPYSFLVLRNGSQDIQSARLRDSFANRAAEALHVMAARTRPVIVYVNGAYYGIMDLNEGMNQDYLKTHYQTKESTVNIVQRNSSVKRGTADEFVALRRFASTKNMADDAVLKEFAQKVDMDAIIDYIIAQSLMGNYDIHNQNWWNATDGTVLWQPILYDVDRCMVSSSNVLSKYFSSGGIEYNNNGDRIYMEIPCGLKQNRAWCQRFTERFAELLCTDLSEERLHLLLDEMAAVLRPEMKEHIARWKMPASLEAWEKNIQAMHQYISKRCKLLPQQIKHQFSLSDAEWDALLAKYQ